MTATVEILNFACVKDAQTGEELIVSRLPENMLEICPPKGVAGRTIRLDEARVDKELTDLLQHIRTDGTYMKVAILDDPHSDGLQQWAEFRPANVDSETGEETSPAVVVLSDGPSPATSITMGVGMFEGIADPTWGALGSLTSPPSPDV